MLTIFGSPASGLIQAATEQGVVLPAGAAERLAAAIEALGNGVAVEHLADPDAVSDDLDDWAVQLLLDGFERWVETTEKERE